MKKLMTLLRIIEYLYKNVYQQHIYLYTICKKSSKNACLTLIYVQKKIHMKLYMKIKPNMSITLNRNIAMILNYKMQKKVI